MNRDLFNEKKRLSKLNEENDSSWAKDISFNTLEKKIVEDKKATEYALRPLDEKASKRFSKSKKSEQYSKSNKTESSKKDTSDKRNSSGYSDTNDRSKMASSEAYRLEKIGLKKSRKRFLVFLGVWSFVLIAAISVFLFKFHGFLTDYEKVYQESLAYHKMDEIMKVFEAKDVSAICSLITIEPEISQFETKDNFENYIGKVISDKTVTYTEASESTDKNPVYYLMADEYIIGKVTMNQSDKKREHDLPIYVVSDLEIFSQTEWDANVKAYEDCTVYVNDIKVTPEYVYRVDTPGEKHFEEFTTLPVTKFYKVEGLYEEPTIKVVNGFGQELKPVLNTSTGVYETPISAPKEIEDEMIAFAKEAVDTYAKVVCRDLNDSALDKIFTRNNNIVKEIKASSGSLKYFPNHKTKSIEDTIIEFIPYTEDAFYCEIEHIQHLTIYGNRDRDVTTDAKFYYYKENGNWKVCAVVF